VGTYAAASTSTRHCAASVDLALICSIQRRGYFTPAKAAATAAARHVRGQYLPAHTQNSKLQAQQQQHAHNTTTPFTAAATAITQGSSHLQSCPLLGRQTGHKPSAKVTKGTHLQPCPLPRRPNTSTTQAIAAGPVSTHLQSCLLLGRRTGCTRGLARPPCAWRSRQGPPAASD
jgi:hypothetical protein